MCGICGIIDFKNKLDLNHIIQNMMISLKHRGPDGNGYFIEKNIALGHVRLSIIDLSVMANQPLISYDENLIIVFNGEIYNFKELKNILSHKYFFKSNSDTEVILYAYQEWGDDCLKYFNGMFSFVIYNKKNNIIFASRDRFGIKPFYYFISDDFFIFASEIKGILSSKLIKAELNEQLLYDFIVFNRTNHSDQTCFKSIYNLRPGHKLIYDINDNNYQTSQWYFLPEIVEEKKQFDYYKEKLQQHLNNSIKLHLTSDVPVGATLSGGLDSSTIVALSRLLIPNTKAFNTFSAVYDQSWIKDEMKYINKLAKHIDIKTHYIRPTAEQLISDIENIIYHQEEPFASASLFASWCVFRATNKKGIKVLLSGQGADELFSYNYMAAFYFYELLKNMKFLKLIKEIALFYYHQSYGKHFTIQLFLLKCLPNLIMNHLLLHNQSIITDSFYHKYKHNSEFFNNFFNSDTLNENVKNHLLFKIQHLLRVEDRNSMAFSVESRVPFLEHELVEFAICIPSEYKIHNGKVKYILKESMKSFLPEMIINRNDKIGFETPFDMWLREPCFVRSLDDLLYNNDQPMENYINIPIIRSKWEKHKSGKQNNADAIWKYYYLTNWFNIFFR